jgi:preprotein translocase subunit SecA
LLAADNIGETIADFRQEVLDATVSRTFRRNRQSSGTWPAWKLRWPATSPSLPIQQWLDEDDHLYEETFARS